MTLMGDTIDRLKDAARRDEKLVPTGAGAAIGAVAGAVLPIPFVGPVLGAVIGGVIGRRTAANKLNRP